MNRQHTTLNSTGKAKTAGSARSNSCPSNDPEGREFLPDMVGYLLGYAQLTNARALALVGDPEAGAYELLFSFSTPGDKDQFLDLVCSNEEMGSDYIENDFM
jgi:hypothetical protein